MRRAALLVIVLSGLAVACASGGSTGRGRELYAENGCASCHGPAGRGDGPVGKTLTPPPRDFKNDASYRRGTDERSIAATLEIGIAENGAKMPAFAHLTEHERLSLAAYVISLRNTP